MPEVRILPTIQTVGAWIARNLNMLPSHVDLSLSEHRRGAAEMLDVALDEEAGGRWTEQGTY